MHVSNNIIDNLWCIDVIKALNASLRVTLYYCNRIL